MKEGRKYGVVIVVASQGAADFHKDVIGNAGTKVIFRTNFPASKQVAGYLRGRSGQDLSTEIEKLGVGQAYVSTPDSPQARKAFMAREADVAFPHDVRVGRSLMREDRLVRLIVGSSVLLGSETRLTVYELRRSIALTESSSRCFAEPAISTYGARCAARTSRKR